MTSQAPGDLATILAQNIKAARVAAGMRQIDLARAVEIDPMVVSKWERGWHRPSNENMERLAAALGQTVAWFYTDHQKAAA